MEFVFIRPDGVKDAIKFFIRDHVVEVTRLT